jgi:SpoVK/Ycf46/Vps4 family AAA+-type ATPase
MTDTERLESLFAAQYPALSIITMEEQYALGVVREAVLNSGADVLLWSVIGGVRDPLVTDNPPIPDTEHPAAGLWYLLSRPEPLVAITLDLQGHLKDERILRLVRDLIARFRRNGGHLGMIDHGEGKAPGIPAEAERVVGLLPGEVELDTMIRDTLRRMNREERIEVEISKRGLKTIIRNLRGLTRRQAEQIIVDVVAEDRRFDEGDINRVLARKRQALAGGGLLEYIEAPVDLDEIGGLRRLKTWLNHRQIAMTEEAGTFGLGTPRGVLMLGVQGAGKSLCAKAIATAWQRPLLRMDPCALYDRYVGESERRLREALRQAEGMAPIVLWIDEIEKGFASAASRSTDGGLSQRMFGTLLTWMQEHAAPVFMVATANDIEALPPELLRKGRFDEIFFVDLPVAETRQSIFAIHLKKRGRDVKAFDLEALAKASEGYSGAEIEQAIVSGLHEAFADKRELNTQLILDALAGAPPLSVTMAEDVAELRAWAEGRCVQAD